MTTTYISLGSNMGNREVNLDRARHFLGQLPGTKMVKTSREMCTKPWGKTDQEDFLNQVVVLETEFNPYEFLNQLLNIERIMGRERLEKWGPRNIDLDILLYGDEVINEPILTVPHPFLCSRDFILKLLLELNPDLVLPGGEKIKTVWDKLKNSKPTFA